MLGLFLGKLIFGGTYYWKEFCVSKWVGLDNKNSLKHYEKGGLIIRRIFASEIWGANFREGLFFFLGGGVGLTIRMLRYIPNVLSNKKFTSKNFLILYFVINMINW